MTSEEYGLVKKKEIIDYYKSLNFNDITFIGIDASLTSTGIAAVRAGKYINGYEIKIKSFGYERWSYLVSKVLDFIKDYNNVLIIIEGYAFAAQGRSVISLGELGGIFRFVFGMKKISYLELPPTSLKKFVGNQAHMKKEMVSMFILKKFKIECSGHDLADAVGLSFFGYNVFRYVSGNDNYTLAEKETFDKFLSLDKKPKPKKKKSTKSLNAEIGE